MQLRTRTPRKSQQTELTDTSPNHSHIAPKAPNRDTEIPKQTKYSNAWIRLVYGLLMLAGFGAILYLGPLFVVALVFGVQAAVYFEVISIGNSLTNIPWSRTLNWYFLLSTTYFLYGASLVRLAGAQQKTSTTAPVILFLRMHHNFISFVLYLSGFVIFVLSLKKGLYRTQFRAFCWTHMALLLIVVSSHFIISNIFSAMIWFILPISLVITNDTAAYFFGFYLGRTPLINVSPKKTWEGFVGGAIVTVLFGVWFAKILAGYAYMTVPYTLHAPQASLYTQHPQNLLMPIQFHALILATFASLIAPFGGFFASGVKRAFEIKDFAQSIPGHGGLTDRMDCQFLMGVFTHFYIASFVNDVNGDGEAAAAGVALVMDQVVKLDVQSLLAVYRAIEQLVVERGLVVS